MISGLLFLFCTSNLSPRRAGRNQKDEACDDVGLRPEKKIPEIIRKEALITQALLELN